VGESSSRVSTLRCHPSHVLVWCLSGWSIPIGRLGLRRLLGVFIGFLGGIG